MAARGQQVEELGLEPKPLRFHNVVSPVSGPPSLLGELGLGGGDGMPRKVGLHICKMGTTHCPQACVVRWGS